MDTPAGLPSQLQAAAVRAGEDGLSALSHCIPCIESELSPAPKPLIVAPRVSLPDFDLAGRRSHDKADPAASRGQPRGARALREQRSHSSCSFFMAASMSRPAASLPRRRARRHHAARLAPCPAFLFFSFLSFSDLSPYSLTSLSLSRCNAPMAARSSPSLAPAPPHLAAIGNVIATLGSDPDAHPRPPSAASPCPGLPCGAPPRAQPKAGPLFLR